MTTRYRLAEIKKAQARVMEEIEQRLENLNGRVRRLSHSFHTLEEKFDEVFVTKTEMRE